MERHTHVWQFYLLIVQYWRFLKYNIVTATGPHQLSGLNSVSRIKSNSLTGISSEEAIGAEEKQEPFVGSLSSATPEGRNPGQKGHTMIQSHRVIEVLCWSAMAGERGTNTQPICMVTIEITTYERELGWVLNVGQCCLRKRERDVGVGSSLFGGWHNTQTNKRYERRGSCRQRYSWVLGVGRSVQGSDKLSYWCKEQLRHCGRVQADQIRRDINTKQSGTNCGREGSAKQMISGLSAAA